MATIADGHTIPFDLVHRPGRAAARAGADLPALVAVRRPRRPGRASRARSSRRDLGRTSRRPRARPGGRAPRLPQRLPPPRLARLRGRRAGARRSSAPTTPGRTGSTARCSPRRAPTASPASTRGARARAAAGRDVGTVRLRQPRRRSRRRLRSSSASCPELSPPRHRPRRAPLPQARPRPSTTPTGRSAARTSSSATTARSRTRASRRSIDVAPDAYLLEASAGASRASTARSRERRRGATTRAGEIARGQFHFLFPNTALNVMPGRAEPLDRPDRPARRRADLPLPRLLRRAGRRRGVDRGLLAFDDQVGAEDRALVERVQAGCATGLSTTAGCFRSPSG